MCKAVERRLSRLTATRLLVFVAAAVAAVALPASAGAGQPVTSYPTHHVFAVLTDVCPFPVAVEGDSPGTERDYFDESGALTRIEVHATEQDTFTANGKSLTGEPYAFNIRILFDSSGAITQFVFAGVVERVVLPDGSLFLAAGLVDFAAHGFPEALIAPDKGTSGNVEGFCAALSP